jgi:hypothetical protein
MKGKMDDGKSFRADCSTDGRLVEILAQISDFQLKVLMI